MFSGFKVYWFWVFWVLGFWGIMSLLGLGSWVSDFLVQDFGSKILWAFSFLVQGVFLVLNFCVPDFWVLGSLCHRLLGPRFF